MFKYPNAVIFSFVLLGLTGCQLTDTKVLETKKSTNVEPQKPATIQTVPQIVAVEVAPEPKPLTPQEVDNVWQRIQMQFALEHPMNKKIQSQLNWYKRHPKYIARVSERAKPYLHFIVEEIEKRNMPIEIALLPIVESAFDPFAYSHGQASGMWQIISGTGKRFGLEQNWWYDGRRDVYASTHAALDYLQYLHKYFKGDWLHALAAYNSGEGRVGRAIRKNRKAGKKTDFWSLSLPRETRSYVPKLLALAKLLEKPSDYQMQWPHIDNKPAIAIVDTGSQMDLALAAKLADISLEKLYKLNPGFNRWATDPDGSHKLLLPIEQYETFNQGFAKLNKKDRLNWVRYKIVSGDSLGLIAKRHKTTVAIVKEVNAIEGNNIVAGKFLLIPVASTKLSDYKLSSDLRLASKQNKKRSGQKFTHLVQSGDNLWDIARKYKVGHRSIAKWNGMAPNDPIKPGQSLVIWKKGKASTSSGNSNNVTRSIRYKVRRGDSIAKIAQKFNLKINDVKKWNALMNKKYIQPGQMLKLYVDVTKITS